MTYTLTILAVGMGALSTIPKPAPKPLSDREKVLAVASSQVGITEATGRNDGEVDKYLTSVGLGGTRSPYCAAFNHWVGKEALGASPYPRSAWSPDHVKGGQRVTESTPVKGGEAFGVWFAAKRRIAHTGLLEKRDGVNLITIEANTNANAAVGSDADRDGQGVYRKRRHWRTVHTVRDWMH